MEWQKILLVSTQFISWPHTNGNNPT